MYRIGIGYDIHKISKDEKLYIGGVKIPSKFGLLGHSDADLLIHSICDAILGALAKGDIGEIFSNKDNRNKNKRSSYFLKKILKIMEKEDYKIVNIDTTIICEKPKLSKYKAKIRKSLASILLIPLGCISVKATTSEELGHIGEKLGIACKTVLLLRKNNLDKL